VAHRRIVLAGLAASVATTGLAAGLGGCGTRVDSSNAQDPGSNGANTGTGGAGTVSHFAPAHRSPAPTVAGTLLTGKRFTMTAWAGRVVVINFWGSWCAPCRAEAPDLEATDQATHRLGVEFLGVDIRDGRDAARAFVTDHHIGYPSLFDPPGRVVLGFRQVPPNVVPATVILDRRHRIAVIFRKALLQTELQPAVTAIAAEKS
jgi:thiol-disulfide isomerase/thioredoxin